MQYGQPDFKWGNHLNWLFAVTTLKYQTSWVRTSYRIDPYLNLHTQWLKTRNINMHGSVYQLCKLFETFSLCWALLLFLSNWHNTLKSTIIHLLLFVSPLWSAWISKGKSIEDNDFYLKLTDQFISTIHVRIIVYICHNTGKSLKQNAYWIWISLSILKKH